MTSQIKTKAMTTVLLTTSIVKVRWVYNFTNIPFPMNLVSPLPETNVIHAKGTATPVPWLEPKLETDKHK